MIRLTLAAALLLGVPFAQAAEPIQLVDRSYVDLPRQVGTYSLTRTIYEPKFYDAGISAEYHVRGAPGDVFINLYVYPVGDGDEAALSDEELGKVAQAIQMLPGMLAYEEKAPTFFTVDRPAEKDAQAEGSGALAQFLRQTAPPTSSVGRRQDFGLRENGTAMRSVAFVFTRNMYHLKIRISTPSASMGQEAFDEFADAAARALVPNVQIHNYGTCARVKADAKDMLAATAKVRRRNCEATESEKRPVPDGYERTEIKFPPLSWGRWD